MGEGVGGERKRNGAEEGGGSLTAAGDKTEIRRNPPFAGGDEAA